VFYLFLTRMPPSAVLAYLGAGFSAFGEAGSLPFYADPGTHGRAKHADFTLEVT